MTSPRTRAIRARAWTIAGTAAVAAGALAYTGLVDPHRTGSLFPPCPLYTLTGWYCPACGGLRMTHDVLHGDLAAAVTDNVVALVGIPLLALWLLVRRRRGRPVVDATVIIVTCVVFIGWGVLRNLPGFPLQPTLLAR